LCVSLGLEFCAFSCFSLDYFVLVLFAFVDSSVLRQEIGWLEWGVKPSSIQSLLLLISVAIRSTILSLNFYSSFPLSVPVSVTVNGNITALADMVHSYTLLRPTDTMVRRRGALYLVDTIRYDTTCIDYDIIYVRYNTQHIHVYVGLYGAVWYSRHGGPN